MFACVAILVDKQLIVNQFPTPQENEFSPPASLEEVGSVLTCEVIQ